MELQRECRVPEKDISAGVTGAAIEEALYQFSQGIGHFYYYLAARAYVRSALSHGPDWIILFALRGLLCPYGFNEASSAWNEG